MNHHQPRAMRLAPIALLCTVGLASVTLSLPATAEATTTTEGMVTRIPAEGPVPERHLFIDKKGTSFGLSDPARLSPGMIVELPVDKNTGEAHTEGADALNGKQAPSIFAAGNRSLRDVILVNAVHKSISSFTSTTEEQMHNHFNFLRDFYAEASEGAVQFRLERIHLDPIKINSGCVDLDGIRQEVLPKLGMSTDPSALANKHVVVLHPEVGGCPAGLGYDGLGFSAVFDNKADTVVHEVGHNLGLDHASSVHCPDGKEGIITSTLTPKDSRCSVVEYGNMLDVMGHAWTNHTASLGAASADVMGWGVARHQFVKPGRQELAPFTEVHGARYLRHDDPQTDTTYFIAYRSKNVGRDKDYYAQFRNTNYAYFTEGVEITKVHWAQKSRSFNVARQEGAQFDFSYKAGDTVSLAEGRLIIAVEGFANGRAIIRATVNGDAGPTTTNAKSGASVAVTGKEELGTGIAKNSMPVTPSD